LTADPVVLDTSAAVALVVTGHEGHAATIKALQGRRLGLAGHAWFETLSVLTRLPYPARRSPTEAARIIAHNFPEPCFLSRQATLRLTQSMTRRNIAGGSVYDALVGSAAALSELTLVSRDRHAIATYRAVGAEVELIS
jgi:predicted nucleic acid-binding protein